MRAAFLTAKETIEVMPREEAALGPDGVRVRIRACGICGSDLHYFHHFRMGDFPVRELFVLGHEAAGEVIEVGSAVSRVKVGDHVAVNPSNPCGECHYCRNGRELLCPEMRFTGSSRIFPHMQGMFTETFATVEGQCYTLPQHIPFHVAAFAEPLSVALHATGLGGPLLGANVLITGSGPIGSLVMLVARLAGAASVTMTDVLTEPLKKAEALGANRVVNVSDGDDALVDPREPRGAFDVTYECSGNPHGVRSGIRHTRPDGTFVQIGMFADPNVTMPLDLIMSKELTIRSSYRFDKEFGWAVKYLSEGRIDVGPLHSHTFAMDEAMQAFKVASDRRQSMKVQLNF